MTRTPNKQKLFPLTITKAPAKAAPYLIWDLVQRGLALRVECSGYKSYKCIYAHHGRTRWLHLGAADAIGLADARRLAAKTMLAVAEGQDPAAERRAQRGEGTFQELADRYLIEHAKRRNRSWPQARALVERFLLPRWGKLSAADISRTDVKAVLATIGRHSVANQTLAAASAIFTFAIRNSILRDNPCKLVESHEMLSRERVLNPTEIPLFWAAFDSAGLVASIALKTLLLTGQRPGEVCHMRREHLEAGWWELPGKPDPKLGWPGTKNGQTHRVWLPAPVQALLAELDDEPQAAGFVFSNVRGKALSSLDGAMRRICAELGAPRAVPHDLRRSHGSTVTAMGFGREIMNRVQNHREGGIADVYDRHGYADEIKRVMEAVAAHIMRLATDEAAESNVVTLRGR
jgi:integrase